MKHLIKREALQPYRILIVDNSPAFTGAYKSISSMAEALKDDFHFFFCLPTKSALVESSGALRPTFTLPFLEIRKSVRIVFYGPVLIYNSIRLLRFIKRNEIHILHVNDLYNLVGVVIKRLYPRLNVVYHVRLLPSSYSGWVYRLWLSLILKSADHIVCVSEIVKRHVSRDRGISLLYDAISHEVRPERPVKLGSTINILYLANYTSGKGHEDAIKAFAKAFAHNSNLRLLMAGGDLGRRKNERYKQGLRELAMKEGVADRITFEGFVSDIGPLYDRADIFLNCSRSESFSFTCLEALTHGVPVVVTDSGGPREVFEPGFGGVLVPVGDVHAMAEAIVKLAADPALRSQMGQRGRAYVCKKFNSSERVNRMRELYLALTPTGNSRNFVA